MFGKTLLSFGTLLVFAAAQAAPGFPVSASSQLTITYGNNNTVSPPGELIPRGDTAQPPTISSPIWSAGGSGPRNGVLLMVDLDVPLNGTRVQLLHWMAANVTLASSNSSGVTPLNIPVGIAPYVQPSPPVGDVPHAYTFILFSQPANFSVPAQYAGVVQTRIAFNTSQFVKDAGLGEPLAANYMRVQNLTGTPTTTFPPARPTRSAATSASSPAAFPGAAQPVMVGSVTLWVGWGAALLAGIAAVVL